MCKKAGSKKSQANVPPTCPTCIPAERSFVGELIYKYWTKPEEVCETEITKDTPCSEIMTIPFLKSEKSGSKVALKKECIRNGVKPKKKDCCVVKYQVFPKVSKFLNYIKANRIFRIHLCLGVAKSKP